MVATEKDWDSFYLTLMASMAYSTWKRRPSGEKVLTPLKEQAGMNLRDQLTIRGKSNFHNTFDDKPLLPRNKVTIFRDKINLIPTCHTLILSETS